MIIKRSTLIIFCISLLAQSNAQTSWHLLGKVHLSGNGKWDYLKLDKAKNRIFVTHTDRVHVVDLKINKEIGQISNLKGANHISLFPEINKGFISNGAGNTLTVFNYTTLEKIETFKMAGINPDPMCYDAFTKNLLVFCDNNLAIAIDPVTNREVFQINLPGAPEFALPDNAGLIYNNLENKDKVAIIDLKKNQVIKTYSLKAKSAPTGMAADLSANRLFVVCRGLNELCILNSENGEVIKTMSIGKEVDGIQYDSARHLIVCSGGDGTITFIERKGDDTYKLIKTMKTKLGAKTLGYDETNGNIYTCAATFLNKKGRTKPDSFELLIYALVN